MASLVNLHSWPFPASTRTLRWRIGEASLIGLVHLASNIYLRGFQKVQTKNLGILKDAVLNRPANTPLVTVSNHKSCIDDPILHSLLPFRGVFNGRSIRWVPAAREICFINKFVSSLCARVRLVPVVRGEGVYQKALSYCIDKLNECQWVHIYPEGKVNITGENFRMKWGVGQLIAEARNLPTVIPYYHFGMDSILPNRSPYIPKFFQKLTVMVGDPIDFSPLFEAHNKTKHNAVVLRRQITDLVQEKLEELKVQAESLHIEWTPKFPVQYRTL